MTERGAPILWEPPPANREAERAAKLPKGKPLEQDAPPLTTFPGKKRKPTPGQLDIYGHVVE